MIQMMIDIPTYGHWVETNQYDPAGRSLADRHYSRQKVGTPKFSRPGKKIILRTPAGDALWITWKGFRTDGLDAWECVIFRNESTTLSSKMITTAIDASIEKWGALPIDGIITYVAPNKIKSTNAGCCFKKAGFKYIGQSKRRNLMLFQYK